jgi:hypothetical protein
LPILEIAGESGSRAAWYKASRSRAALSDRDGPGESPKITSNIRPNNELAAMNTDTILSTIRFVVIKRLHLDDGLSSEG